MKIAISVSLLVLAITTMGGAAHAKLPAPTPEAKAAAEAAAAKTAWTNKLGAYELCKAQDKVSNHYLTKVRASGKAAAAPVETPPCTDPGPFAAVEAKPIEAAGAHSPAATATSPPSTQQPDAVANPAKKP